MDEAEFEAVVAQALEDLPPEIQRRMENVEVVIAAWPTREQLRSTGLGPRHTLFGLYEGIPLTARTTHYNLVLPDKITIFQGPIESAFRTTAEMREQIRRTVLHEVGHHFGLDEEQLRRLDY